MNDLRMPSLLTPAPAQRAVFQQFQSGHGYEQFEGTGTLSKGLKAWLILTFHRIVASGASEGTECNEATSRK